MGQSPFFVTRGFQLSLLRPSPSGKVGIAVAALAMLPLLYLVSVLVIRWCPRGANCEEASQILFGLGIIFSFALSAAAGLVARDVADRFAAHPPR